MKYFSRLVAYLKDLNLLLAMKISIVILIVSIVQVSASTFAQNLTIKESDAPMARVLKEIRKQSGYKFIIDGDLLKSLRPVSVSVKSGTLEEALLAVFAGQPITYEIVEKTIILKQKQIPKRIIQQDKIKIKGKVEVSAIVAR
jgi:hypothetical protein